MKSTSLTEKYFIAPVLPAIMCHSLGTLVSSDGNSPDASEADDIQSGSDMTLPYASVDVRSAFL